MTGNDEKPEVNHVFLMIYQARNQQRKFVNKYLGGYTKGWIGTGDDSIISDEILEFDPLTGQWKILDRMIQTRGAHAMAAIDFDPGLCVESKKKKKYGNFHLIKKTFFSYFVTLPQNHLESVPEPISCPTGWSGFQEKCYKFISEQKSFSDAESYCNSSWVKF